MKSLYRKVESFDGQTITIDGKPSYELGSFLGGGAAGVVYEGTDVSETSQFRPVAIKILNPVGFRLAPAATLRRCVVARRGQLVAGVSASSSGSGGCSSSSSSASTSSCPAAPTAGGAGAGTGATPAAAASGFPSTGAGVGVPPGGVKPHKLGPEHVWWLVSPNTKQVLAAYMDPRYGSLVELPLPKCIEIWGLNPGMGARAPPPSAASSPSAATTPATAAAAASAANPAYSAQDSWGDGSSAGSSTTGSTATTTTTTTERGFDAEGEADLFGDGGGYPADGRRGAFEVKVDGMGVSIPWLPPKYVQWLSQRRKVKREINNMGRVGGHRNVLELLSVLELLQDSKSTLFLILELVTGGELLDHIRLAGEEGRRATGFRTRTASALRAEGAAQRYFSQLLSGLAYCHRRGVCHRDLSPSNLLLAESPQGDTPPVLKVADFGLSACCAGGFSATGNENQDARTKERRGFPHRVRSVVGSPYYMAPEVTTGSTKGYDGFKADAWSCGVVLYTMLTQSLPFERDLSRCPRYKRFKSWADKHGTGSSSSSSSRKSRTVPRTIPRFCSPSSASPSTSPLTTTLPSDSAAVNNTPAIPSPLLQPPASSTLQGAPQGRISPPSAVASAPVPPPAWLFPPTIPPGAKSLLVSLLAPHPSRRMSVEQALLHPWLVSASRGDAAATAAAAAASSGVLQGGSVPVSSVAPTISTTAAADSAGATLLVEGNGPQGGVGGGAADSARDFVGEGGHAHQQQHQRCVGSGAFFTVPGGGRGSVVNNRNIGGGGDSQIPGGNGGTADSSANEKVSREGGGWGSSTANLPREFGCSAIPSTTSFP